MSKMSKRLSYAKWIYNLQRNTSSYTCVIINLYNLMGVDFPDHVTSNGFVSIRNQILWNLLLAISHN